MAGWLPTCSVLSTPRKHAREKVQTVSTKLAMYCLPQCHSMQGNDEIWVPKVGFQFCTNWDCWSCQLQEIECKNSDFQYLTDKCRFGGASADWNSLLEWVTFFCLARSRAKHNNWSLINLVSTKSDNIHLLKAIQTVPETRYLNLQCNELQMYMNTVQNEKMMWYPKLQLAHSHRQPPSHLCPWLRNKCTCVCK